MTLLEKIESMKTSLLQMQGDKKGQAGAAVIALVLLFGVAAILGTLMSTVAAKVYTTSVPWQGINNATISADVNAATENSFEAFNQATLQLPLLAIIIVMTVVLSAIAGFLVFMQGGGRGFGAL